MVELGLAPAQRTSTTETEDKIRTIGGYAVGTATGLMIFWISSLESDAPGPVGSAFIATTAFAGAVAGGECAVSTVRFLRSASWPDVSVISPEEIPARDIHTNEDPARERFSFKGALIGAAAGLSFIFATAEANTWYQALIQQPLSPELRQFSDQIFKPVWGAMAAGYGALFGDAIARGIQRRRNGSTGS